MNFQATYEILKQAREEMLKCKRNKSGSINENSLHAVKVRFQKRFKEIGEDHGMYMLHDLARSIK